MHFNIGSSSSASSSKIEVPSLPADHPPVPSSSRRPPPSCPMHSEPSSAAPANFLTGQARATGAKCPVQHDTKASLNPLNSIPLNLSTARQPGQKMALPTDREASTIPRPQSNEDGGDAFGGIGGATNEESTVWEYPSPQQFYNALVRKGWETPEESIEMVVAIHNFLNEEAWQEVMKWEKRFPGGEQAKLERFQGRPGELSPKAQLHLWAGKIFPSKFNTEPPFDRHDWIVTRPAVPTSPNDKNTPPKLITTRYVIDYYSAPPDEEGNPVFSLDVRPALDNLESINQRIRVGLEEWRKGEAA
ncbi:cytochrome c/c1 heme-lyase [Kockovaella imperatae]|uniref:Holocytochrome c-type synthase n=1 Tax=Kockovaella imperatae TaxID=4999 RepID=A0A1Y1UME4_9TREE|nr:cytochrome c/c1 heme-lyase [Kockovaella imperatae]ORX39223.1 cytochrome c/c1 heme-lyase [Kockovaella imperatae]